MVFFHPNQFSIQTLFRIPIWPHPYLHPICFLCVAVWFLFFLGRHQSWLPLGKTASISQAYPPRIFLKFPLGNFSGWWLSDWDYWAWSLQRTFLFDFCGLDKRSDWPREGGLTGIENPHIDILTACFLMTMNG